MVEKVAGRRSTSASRALFPNRAVGVTPPKSRKDRMESARESVVDTLRQGLVPGSWFVAQPRSEGGLVEHEKATNKLLRAVRDDDTLRTLLLEATNGLQNASANDSDVCLLVPQSVTLDDVVITDEFLRAHLVSHCNAGETPCPFTSLGGLCGTFGADGTIAIHGRQQSGASVSVGLMHGPWRTGSTVPQLEADILVLREAKLQASEQLPLRAPLSIKLISDPLFYPGYAVSSRAMVSLADLSRVAHCTHCTHCTHLHTPLVIQLPLFVQLWLEARFGSSEVHAPFSRCVARVFASC